MGQGHRARTGIGKITSHRQPPAPNALDRCRAASDGRVIAENQDSTEFQRWRGSPRGGGGTRSDPVRRNRRKAASQTSLPLLPPRVFSPSQCTAGSPPAQGWLTADRAPPASSSARVGKNSAIVSRAPPSISGFSKADKSEFVDLVTGKCKGRTRSDHVACCEIRKRMQLPKRATTVDSRV